MRHGSLFSGIGGFDLAAQWMGWENVFHCEWNPFGQKVLHYYWPEAEQFTDITKSDFTKYANKIDILTGGFPCQPYSMAGKRLGKEDDRHLWPEMLRAIREIQPTWIVGENVLGLVNWSGGLVFHEVQADLEAEGYEVQPYVLPAVSVNAPHRRDRVWFVAYRNNNGLNQCHCKHEKHTSEGRINAFCDTCKGIDNGHASDTNSRGLERSKEVGWNSLNAEWKSKFGHASDTLCNGIGESRNREQSEQSNKNGIERRISSDTTSFGFSTKMEDGKLGRKRFSKSSKRYAWESFPTVSAICHGDDGLSNRLDTITFSKWRNESIKAGGNAVVPQVVYQIFKAIEQYELKNS